MIRGFFYFYAMLKKLFLATLLLVAVGATAQTHYFTVKVSIAFKNKVISHRMILDTGTDPGHPLFHKINGMDNGAIKYLKNDNEPIVFTNEVDLLTYFENNGWDLVSVNEVMIIESKYLQYLFKSE